MIPAYAYSKHQNICKRCQKPVVYSICFEHIDHYRLVKVKFKLFHTNLKIHEGIFEYGLDIVYNGFSAPNNIFNPP